MFEIKSGMRVKLANNLSRSIREYGGSSAKRNMAGTYQYVHSTTSGNSFTVKVDSGIYVGVWTISKFDVIEPPTEPIRVEPELFNLENLDL